MQLLWMSHEINVINLNVTFQDENAFGNEYVPRQPQNKTCIGVA